jgi:hypothetical protein
MATTPDTAKLVPVTAPVPIEADAPRVEVRSQDELAQAVRDGLVPVVAARDYFSVAGGVLVEVPVAGGGRRDRRRPGAGLRPEPGHRGR